MESQKLKTLFLIKSISDFNLKFVKQNEKKSGLFQFFFLFIKRSIF